MSSSLVLPIAASAAIVLAAPFVGQIRGALQAALPGQYRTIVAGIVVACLAIAVAASVARIRERRRLRYGLLALALGAGSIYALATSTGNPEVDAVERFHFVEYGVLAILYFQVWRDRDDLSALALPVMAVTLVGALDELLQWFVPDRVGEMRDVLLNGVAAGCGLLFGLGLHPPRRAGRIVDRRSRVQTAVWGTVTLAACASFFHVVHLGHEVQVDGAGDAAFRSKFSRGALDAAARDRAARWRAAPPAPLPLSREDHYLSEGLWHVEERNEAADAGDLVTAWREQLILERFYHPVFEALPETRWPPARRADVEARAGGAGGAYRSNAHPYPIHAWNPMPFWAAVAAAMAATIWWGGTAPRERRPEPGQRV